MLMRYVSVVPAASRMRDSSFYAAQRVRLLASSCILGNVVHVVPELSPSIRGRGRVEA
jgi:hypothetical protein